MKSKHSGFGHWVHVITFSILCLLVYSSSIGVAFGQKKPQSVPLDVDMDDKQLCNGALSDKQFCDFYDAYNATGALPSAKLKARNGMIKLVKGQIDSYFKMRKDGKSTKIKWLQTLLDFLEVGASTAIAIMNGERAKTVVGAALSGFQGGRTAFNKNFEILQQQVLINKMIAKRAQTYADIYVKMDRPAVGDVNSEIYEWYDAKNDLRTYFLAGTFSDALDTLVKETGSDAEAAEAIVSGLTVGEISPAAVKSTRNVAQILTKDLKDALAGSEKEKEKAETILREIVTALNAKSDKIKGMFTTQKITAESSGEDIRKALFKVKRELLLAGEDNQIIVMDKVIIEIFEAHK